MHYSVSNPFAFRIPLLSTHLGAETACSLASPDELQDAIRLEHLCSYSISKGRHLRAKTKRPLDAQVGQEDCNKTGDGSSFSAKDRSTVVASSLCENIPYSLFNTASVEELTDRFTTATDIFVVVVVGKASAALLYGAALLRHHVYPNSYQISACEMVSVSRTWQTWFCIGGQPVLICSRANLNWSLQDSSGSKPNHNVESVKEEYVGIMASLSFINPPIVSYFHMYINA